MFTKTANIQSVHRLFQRRRFSSSLSSWFHMEERVKEALASQEPVVALESTIIAHGMPWPENMMLAQEVETLLRSKGVVPATIALKNGVCHVGLSAKDLGDLAKSGEEGRATKCSTRELPLFMAAQRHGKGNQWGATTVASTMALAHMAGISTFVTGGIGGVHRDGHLSMDVSADLTQLSKTPVMVVSAGIKSILDIGRTLEVLETLSVPTVTLGSDEFPAFFSPHSGIKTPARLDTASEIASTFLVSRQLSSCGMLVAVPNHDPAGANVERAIQDALTKANEQSVRGRDVTPFVLKEVANQTGGDSLRSNMALVKENARVGADIAIAIAEQKASTPLVGIPTQQERNGAPSVSNNLPQSRVVVMGGAVVDFVAKPQADLEMATSNPGVCSESFGGVGRNVAETLGLLGSNPILVSAVGNDSRGQSMLNRIRHEGSILGIDQGTVRIVDDQHTATYIAILHGSSDKNNTSSAGDLHTAIADMTVLNEIQPPPVELLKHAEILVMDANPSIEALTVAATLAVEEGVSVFFEPTSVQKARNAASCKEFMSCLSCAFPNVDELMAMTGGDMSGNKVDPGDFETVKLAASELLRRMRSNNEAHVVVTMGENGVLLASRHSATDYPQFSHFSPPRQEQGLVQNSTGAGDTLCGAYIHALLQGQDVESAISFGMEAASLSLECAESAISPHLGTLLNEIT